MIKSYDVGKRIMIKKGLIHLKKVAIRAEDEAYFLKLSFVYLYYGLNPG
jgi:hypothetical protein